MGFVIPNQCFSYLLFKKKDFFLQNLKTVVNHIYINTLINDNSRTINYIYI